MPKDETHCASFAIILSAMISLNRLVVLNYTKLNAIIEAKARYKVEMMEFDFQDSDGFTFSSESTKGEEDEEDEQEMCLDLENEIIKELEDITFEEDLVTGTDWEDFMLIKTAKKKKDCTKYHQSE
ncbi:MAG: hypothetical protein EXX96DRAFT_622742 [Benjaminiella poitrasii]|nr:MAG: hypothetical protein EXX96DRAFT_622742 [Benjaminiella poitrasii]